MKTVLAGLCRAGALATALGSFVPPAHAHEVEPAYVDTGLHLQFPAQLAGLRYSKTVTYPKKELGYCVVYEGKSSLGQICVYDLGHRNLPDGIDSQEFKEAVQNAEEGMASAFAAAPFRNGQVIGTGPTTIEAEGKKAQAEVRLFASEMALPDEEPVHNLHLILMTTGLKKFLKLNYTARNMAPDAFAEETKQLIQAFIEANGKTLVQLMK
jgi:hypothetical protein